MENYMTYMHTAPIETGENCTKVCLRCRAVLVNIHIVIPECLDFSLQKL